MNSKLKQLLKSPRVIIFIFFLIAALAAMNPRPFADGIAIQSVIPGSAAADAGIEQPSPKIPPVGRERILAINNVPIQSVAEYYQFTEGLKINQSVQIKTNKKLYRITTQEAFDIIALNGTEDKIVEETVKVNETVSGAITEIEKKINKTVTVPKTEQVSKGVEELGLRVTKLQKTNIRKGLDLQGGTRVLLQPEKKLAEDDLISLIDTMSQRLNVYGLSDLVIRDASDLSGNQYILVEIAGATEQEIKTLIASQGKFEAKVANQTVFVGGKDIMFVCRSADCAGIDPNYGCQVSGNENMCRFRFSITITPEAAQRQADITSRIPLAEDSRYLLEPLVLYLDDKEVDQLSIGTDLKGSPVTEIQISGNGIGANQQQAIFIALDNMKNLQTVLITGSLPVKLAVVKIDVISPFLGEAFLFNAFLAGTVALAAVALYIFWIYRRIAISIPVVIISFSEIFIMMGLASLIGWNMDLAAIAGIIIAVGTGVNHQIIITDETMRGEKLQLSWKQRIKNAFSIIMASYSTVVVALIPLFFAGAGLLKGFALTTIMAASVGVFITRPVFARMIEILLKE